MPATDDIYALESWLREKALEAHTKAMTCKRVTDISRLHLIWMAITHPSILANIESHNNSVALWCECNAYNETIAKIQNGRTNQHPHIPVHITEEFDVR